MITIKKKIWPEYFEAVASGKKKYELRLCDFEIHPEDLLVLEEWDPKRREYTGRSFQAKVTSVSKITMDTTTWREELTHQEGSKRSELQMISFD